MFLCMAKRNKGIIVLPQLITDARPDTLSKPFSEHLCLLHSLVSSLFWLLLEHISCPGENTSARERLQARETSAFYKQKLL